MKGSDYNRIERAIRYLENNVEAQPSLAALSKYLGVSEYHCHRLFKKWAGITPKDFLQVLTLARAKKLLASESKNLLDTSLDLGLSGTGRLYDLFVTHEGMTPGDYKQGGCGIKVFWNTEETPFGKVFLATTARGICGMSFLDSGSPKNAIADLKRSWPGAHLERDMSRLKPLLKGVKAQMSGETKTPLPIELKGTPFQVKVWEALLKIPEGRVTTYQQLAKAIGKAKAVRAVASAVASNPIGYLIPCHRVIRSTGAVGEYHWGADRKLTLLAVEGARQIS